MPLETSAKLRPQHTRLMPSAAASCGRNAPRNHCGGHLASAGRAPSQATATLALCSTRGQLRCRSLCLGCFLLARCRRACLTELSRAGYASRAVAGGRSSAGRRETLAAASFKRFGGAASCCPRLGLVQRPPWDTGDGDRYSCGADLLPGAASYTSWRAIAKTGVGSDRCAPRSFTVIARLVLPARRTL